MASEVQLRSRGQVMLVTKKRTIEGIEKEVNLLMATIQVRKRLQP